MERLHDIFGHSYELIVRGGWRRALRHKEANDLYGIAETGWERCRGASDEVFQGEQHSLDKLRYDIGKREGEVA